MKENSSKTILVTGCSSGIGQAIAWGLHREHYRVFATVRRTSQRAELEARGIETVLLHMDCAESVENAVQTVLERCDNRLYALVNNAAYGQPGAVEDLDRETLRQQFETNVFGTQHLTNLCIRNFRLHREGRIIQISSILGRICMSNRGAYNASKYALEALSDTLRLELHGTGITVSLIEPGPITSRFRENAERAFRANIDWQNSPHREVYQAVMRRLGSKRQAAFTLPAEAVVTPVRHALESRRPRIRYPVTIPTRVLPNLKRFLPDSVMDRLLRRVGDRPDRQRGPG